MQCATLAGKLGEKETIPLLLFHYSQNVAADITEKYNLSEGAGAGEKTFFFSSNVFFEASIGNL